MLKEITKWFKKFWKSDESAPEDAKELIAKPERPVGRPRKYDSATERQRAWRERQKAAAAAKESETAPTIAPAPIMPATGGDIPTERITASNIPWDALSSLIMPGPKAIPPVQPEPVVIAPKLVVPVPTLEPTACFPDWAEESRTDLPPRSPEHIARLLKFETEIQTQERISNDKARYMNRRGSVFRADQQAAISHVTESQGVTTWVRR
jgi:hypothetical protein